VLGAVAVCPQCQRLSARCPSVPREGSRCQALNRPLARFCRYCQEAFADGWFAAALAADSACPRRPATRRPASTAACSG
jgi:hypothetical protein